jgi:UrcA family protein
MTTATSRSTVHFRAALLAIAAGAITVIGTAVWPTAAQAGTFSDAAPQVTVPYGDLNLSTDAGTIVLYRRIAAAAREVCPDMYSRNLSVVAASRACRAEAIANAVHEVHNSRLALVHAAHMQHG